MTNNLLFAVGRDIYDKPLFSNSYVYSMDVGLIHENNIVQFLIDRNERTIETGYQTFWDMTTENIDDFEDAILFDGYWLMPDEAYDFLYKYGYDVKQMNELKEC